MLNKLIFVITIFIFSNLSFQAIPKPSVKLKIYNSAKIGEYITDENDFTLYTYQNDSYKKRSCISDCLQNWPAYTVEQKNQITKESSISAEIGYIELDSKFQVTLNGWPLYYNNEELDGNLINQPVNQAVEKNGGFWFVISPNGKINFQYKTKWASAGKGDINLSDISLFGSKYITDKDGVVLYIYEKDEFLKSNCTGECLVDWPPYFPNYGEKYFDEKGFSNSSPALKVGDGLDPSLISIAKGMNNGRPIYLYAYNGWPLYYYKSERTAGTAKCQAVFLNDGWWWLLLQNGNVNIQENSKSSAPNIVVSYSEGFKALLKLNSFKIHLSLFLSIMWLIMFL